MAKKISVIIKRPGENPYHTNISCSLDNLQRTVDGYIETVTVFEDMVIICNEEGRLNGMKFNCDLCGIQLFGPVIFCGIDGEDFGDIPCDFQYFKKHFNNLFSEEKK